MMGSVIMKKALLVVPHQDDEINLAGNIIDKIKEDFDLYILYSSLDSREEEARIRKQEAYDACSVWNVDRNHIIFLEYPDSPNKNGHHFYTDGDHRIVDDIEQYILELRPEIIFATDFDYHSDHRMLSLAFDTAMGRVLKKNNGYYPIVLKGFCYETAFYGPEDYKASKPERALSEREVLSNCSFEWKNRVSVLGNEKPGVIWSRKAYKALKQHKSQYAVLHARSIINADNVFWLKRTDNLLNGASITVSIGNAELLRDYKVIDTNDIITKDPRSIDYSDAVWFPGVGKNKIEIIWDEEKEFDSIVVHGNPNNDKEINVNISVYANDERIGKINTLSSYGRDTKIYVSQVKAKRMIVDIDNKNTDFGISELEIFNGDIEFPTVIDDKTEVFVREHILLDLFDRVGYKFIVLKTKVIRKLNKLKLCGFW